MYKDLDKYECWRSSCEARIVLLPEGTCEKAKNYVDHNHENNEGSFNELKALNRIKNDCVDAAATLGAEVNALSTIVAFRSTVTSKIYYYYYMQYKLLNV